MTANRSWTSIAWSHRTENTRRDEFNDNSLSSPILSNSAHRPAVEPTQHQQQELEFACLHFSPRPRPGGATADPPPLQQQKTPEIDGRFIRSAVVNSEQIFGCHGGTLFVGCVRRSKVMKPEDSEGSVVSLKEESMNKISDALVSKDPNSVGSGATGQHNLPERKSTTRVAAKRQTAASMLSAKKAKRVSHRRQIRRSHANG